MQHHYHWWETIIRSDALSSSLTKKANSNLSQKVVNFTTMNKQPTQITPMKTIPLRELEPLKNETKRHKKYAFERVRVAKNVAARQVAGLNLPSTILAMPSS
ncbi:hypothetical protein R6Q59_011732 [Mikania micrantha]